MIQVSNNNEMSLIEALASKWERLTNENAKANTEIDSAKKEIVNHLRQVEWPEGVKSIDIEGTHVRGIRSTIKKWRFDPSKITLDWITRLAHTPCAGALNFQIDGDYYANRIDGYELFDEVDLRLEVTYSFSVKLGTTVRKTA